ncbi:hypothetical protein [Dyadobacter frigoris]|nr:hypothetical protein [Dyadobacter frigoris]
MALIMLIFMPGMYNSKKWNTLIYAVSILVFVLSFAGLRDQILSVTEST